MTENHSSKVTGFVHVAEQPLNGNRADGFAEKDFFDGVGVDASKGGEEEEELAEAERLRRVSGANVLGQDQLRLVLKRRDGAKVSKVRRFGRVGENCEEGKRRGRKRI